MAWRYTMRLLSLPWCYFMTWGYSPNLGVTFFRDDTLPTLSIILRRDGTHSSLALRYVRWHPLYPGVTICRENTISQTRHKVMPYWYFLYPGVTPSHESTQSSIVLRHVNWNSPSILVLSWHYPYTLCHDVIFSRSWLYAIPWDNFLSILALWYAVGVLSLALFF